MTILRTMFALAVPDLQRSAAFYSDVPGFEIGEIGDPGWRMYVRDGCRIMVGECPDAIPPAQLALLHTSAGVSRPGTQAQASFGLGFVIIRSIVERHQGSIDAQSLPGKGTRFDIRLPVYRDAEA